jgi:preprotein translocase subunit SecA
MPPSERVRGHAAHVTYTTSKELAADFLRDRLQLGAGASATRWSIRLLRDPAHAAQRGVVMRGLHTVIVDEADSVLIDEAVTPLIIAGNESRSGTDEAFQRAWSLAAALTPGVDYRRDDHHREVELLPGGWHKLDALREHLPALWQSRSRRQELVTQALTAREFFHLGRQYVVEEGKVVIVDEFTGRLMPMRKWRHGLHQAIEAKEGAAISTLDETLARMSFQKFFRLFHHLSGMTGTGQEAASEFWRIYHLPVVCIPTNRPCQRRDLPDRVFAEAKSKWEAISEEVVVRHATGQPVLVGTRSIMASEQLAHRLQSHGLNPTVLNATRHREEAQIVEAAGQRGRVTIATNMAGRGTDIVLGPGVADLGGLHVIATERHESRRIDRQLIGRAGRQGDPGSAQAFVSADDELVQRFAGAAVRNALAQAARRQVRGAEQLASAVFANAQRTAQRQAFKQREQVLKLDDWLETALSFARRA